eukprot:TCALIF_03603-PA protein Name:"Protein of unknown function" AED:0.59 eAED:1.00 QI:0/-1/0/1/-1/1/1/0/241
MDHSLSRSASSGVLTAGHRRPSAESLSERNSPFKDTGQPGAHSHKVLSLTAMNAAKQEAATNGNHSPVTGKPESNPIWNRVNGFQNTPASLALQSKNVPGLCEGRSALNNKPMFNGTPLMAEVESATHPVSLGQCKSDNIEANGRPQSGGSPVVSRAETAPIGLRFPSDAKYTRHDQLIAETGKTSLIIFRKVSFVCPDLNVLLSAWVPFLKFQMRVALHPHNISKLTPQQALGSRTVVTS